MQRATRMKRIKPALTLCIITLLSTVGLSLGDDLETYKATYEKKLAEIILDHRTKTVELKESGSALELSLYKGI